MAERTSPALDRPLSLRIAFQASPALCEFTLCGGSPRYRAPCFSALTAFEAGLETSLVELPGGVAGLRFLYSTSTFCLAGRPSSLLVAHSILLNDRANNPHFTWIGIEDTILIYNPINLRDKTLKSITLRIFTLTIWLCIIIGNNCCISLSEKI